MQCKLLHQGLTEVGQVSLELFALDCAANGLVCQIYPEKYFQYTLGSGFGPASHAGKEFWNEILVYSFVPKRGQRNTCIHFCVTS